MAHYTDEDARRVFGRDMSEVHAYYAEQVQRQRPAIARARANLFGQSLPEHEVPEPAVGDADPDPDEAEDPGETEG